MLFLAGHTSREGSPLHLEITVPKRKEISFFSRDKEIPCHLFNKHVQSTHVRARHCARMVKLLYQRIGSQFSYFLLIRIHQSVYSYLAITAEDIVATCN